MRNVNSLTVDGFMEGVIQRNRGQKEFHQAVQEVVESLKLVLDKHSEYRKAKILDRIIEPERIIIFRVPWINDQGEVVGFSIGAAGQMAVVWNRAGNATALPPLAGDAGSFARGISRRSVVVGTSFDSSGNRTAVVWR